MTSETNIDTIVRVAARGDGMTADGRHAAFSAPGDTLAADGVPMALVTNTRRALTERALASIGRHYFAFSVCGDEVAHGKPAPDAYRRAAALLGLKPQHCLAIEDSVTGAAAAEDAGCPVLVVPNDVEVPGSPRRRHLTSLREIHTELTAGAGGD